MENFVPYELEDIFFGWKSQTAFRSSRNHLETSTQSAYKRKTMNSNQNVWTKSCNERSEKGERGYEERNLKLIVVIVHVTVSLSGPGCTNVGFSSPIHWINDFSERERDSITRACSPILDATVPSFLLVQIKPSGSGRRMARPIPEPLGTICNEPEASLSFQDYVTRKRRAVGTRMGKT